MNIIKKYKTWYDPAADQLVTYSPHWTKKYKDSLIYIGELQANQVPFKLDKIGIYRELYGSRTYYFIFSPYADGQNTKVIFREAVSNNEIF